MKQFFEGLFCLVVGGAFCAAAVFSWMRTRRFIEESVPAVGEVIKLTEHHDEGVTYAPVVRFAGPGGRVVEFTESVSSNPPAHRVGEQVKILYRPEDPTRARVASTLNLYLLAIIFGVIGGAVSIVDLLLAVFSVVG
ncbi:MAG TPA: DUF3592 domain-containing protein [Pyrinomonadaceae bacterium]|jgi:hypothetical protein|nr:DUF3592 domain-containing protein [Pyrinomonadaceae bacterium]